MSASDLINAFATDAILKRQTTDGSYVDHVFVPGDIEESEFLISVQPLEGRELLNFPEAQRSRQFLKGYTAIELKTVDEANKRRADLVVINGYTYEVQRVEYWTSRGVSIVPYWKVYLAEMNPEDVNPAQDNVPDLMPNDIPPVQIFAGDGTGPTEEP